MVYVSVYAMSGAKILDKYYVPAQGTVTVKDVIRLIHTVKKIPAWKTGLFHNNSMLEHDVPIMDLVEDEFYLDLPMLLRDAVDFNWTLPAPSLHFDEVNKGGIASPIFPLPWCDRIESAGEAGVSLSFFPRGLGMHFFGQTNVMITPRNIYLDFMDVDVCFEGLAPRRLIYRTTAVREDFVGAMNSLAFYHNAEIARLPADDEIECKIKVYSTARFPKIQCDDPTHWETSDAGILHWDLRETCLGMRPMPKGLPLVGKGFCKVKEADGHVQDIELMVSFYPGGCKEAKRNQVSLWIEPLCGLEDRKYRIIVDDYWKIADHASVTHWQRGKGFGNVRITVLPLGEKKKPGRRVNWPCMEVAHDVRHLDARRDDGELWLKTPVN